MDSFGLTRFDGFSIQSELTAFFRWLLSVSFWELQDLGFLTNCFGFWTYQLMDPFVLTRFKGFSIQNKLTILCWL